MLKNYIITALRNIIRHKSHSVINILGLSIGFTACILILLYIQDELSYDRFHEQRDKIVRVIWESPETKQGAAITPAPLAPALDEEFPEIREVVRLHRYYNAILGVNDARFEETNFIFADGNIFEVFSFNMIKGDPSTALRDPFTVVLTESKANIYFGDKDPIGEIILFDNKNEFTVTGVMEDLPHNSHLEIDFLGSFQSLEADIRRQLIHRWGYSAFYTYLLLEDGASLHELEAKLPAFVANRIPGGENIRRKLILQPLTDIHLYSSHIAWDITSHSDISYVYSFTAIALFIMLIACINFMNLSTARSSIRAREVGLRKVIGANRAQLIRQFIGETIIVSFIALIIAVALVELLLPHFNTMTGKNISVDYFTNIQYVAAVIGLAVIVGLFAGSYPAFYLSGFEPVLIIKGSHPGGWKTSTLRKVLVVSQFGISIALIIGATIVYQQLEYMRTKHLGFDKEHIIVINNQMDERALERYELYKTEILRHPGIVNVSGSSNVPPSRIGNHVEIRRIGKELDEPRNIKMITVDYNYFETLGIQPISGRTFREEYGADRSESFIISKKAARVLGVDDPVGAEVETDNDWMQGNIIGLVDDIHFGSLHDTVEPLFFSMNPSWYYRISVRIRPDDIAGTLAHLESTWNNIAPEWPFQYWFVDQQLENLYRAEQQLGKIVWYFTGLAIFIACLGLFALASFMIERRTKEIGMRKVLGASVTAIIFNLTTTFTKLVIVANIIAWPVAYYFINRWLENFAYRIEVTAAVFVLAASVTLIIALATIGVQAYRAAQANPVESLRYE